MKLGLIRGGGYSQFWGCVRLIELILSDYDICAFQKAVQWLTLHKSIFEPYPVEWKYTKNCDSKMERHEYQFSPYLVILLEIEIIHKFWFRSRTGYVWIMGNRSLQAMIILSTFFGNCDVERFHQAQKDFHTIISLLLYGMLVSINCRTKSF